MEHPLSGFTFVAFTCIFAPLFEEVIFRGIVFRGLLSSMPSWAAVLSSALLFALPHEMSSWPLIFALGVGLALIYYRSGNLMISIWTHAGWNLLVLLFSMQRIIL